jgi:chromosome segregation ATPase
MHKDPKEYFMDKLEENIREVEEQLDELETKMEDAGWEPELDYDRQIEALRLRLEDLKKEAERFEAASDSTWSEFKRSCENTLTEIAKDGQELSDRMDAILLE